MEKTKKKHRVLKTLGIILAAIVLFMVVINVIPPKKNVSENPFIVGKGKLPMIAAHRGGSDNNPENTMLAFYTGLYMGANGIETDVRRTKDGRLVLFHDSTLDRVTEATGNFDDFTYEELQQLWVTKEGLQDKIVLFEDFLQHFSDRKYPHLVLRAI